MRMKTPAYGSLRDEDFSEKKPTSCVMLAVVLACLTALGIILAVAVLERPCSSENGETVPPLDPSSDICSMELVESIPLYMDYNHSATFGVPLEEVWKGLLAMATEQLDVVSFYWTLTGSDIGVNSSSAFPGTFILTELEDLPARNVSVRALISKQTVRTNSTDLKNLREKGLYVLLKKEIASILSELRRVQRQLEVMNTVVKPSDQGKTSSMSSSSGVRPSRVVSSQDWRTSPSVSRRGGGPRPGDRVRGSSMVSDGREGRLV